MMHIRPLQALTPAALLLVGAALLGACSPSEPSPSTTAAAAPPPAVETAPTPTAAQALQQARALYGQSVELGFSWVATATALDAAQAAFDNGDEAAALAAANRAITLAQASIEQAHAEADAWRTRAPFGDS